MGKSKDGVRRPTKREQKSLSKIAAATSKQPIADKEETTKTDNSRPIEEFPDLLDVLPGLMARSRGLAVEESRIKEERRELNDEIKALLEAAGHNSIRSGDLVAVRYENNPGDKISPELLLTNGVDSDVIAASTVPGKKTWAVQVRKIKAQGLEETMDRVETTRVGR